METHTHNWLERTELLLGSEKLELLRNAHVLVVGLGGVGAYAAEMIARAGVGRMTVADADTVNATNINRQLVALHSTVGRPKAEVLAERLRDINPGIGLTVVDKYIKDEETYILLDAARYDYVVDAIDTLSPKLALIAASLERGLPLVSSMGAGAKTDPTKLEIADISKTHHCPLAHMLRKRLHKIGIRRGFRAVFSPEPMREGAMILCEGAEQEIERRDVSYIRAVRNRGCCFRGDQFNRRTGGLKKPTLFKGNGPNPHPKTESRAAERNSKKHKGYATGYHFWTNTRSATPTSGPSALGSYTGYPDHGPRRVADRCRETDVVITNKVVFRRPSPPAAPRLRLICVAATGMNHIDLKAAAELGIAVKNAVVSTHAVTEPPSARPSACDRRSGRPLRQDRIRRIAPAIPLRAHHTPTRLEMGHRRAGQHRHHSVARRRGAGMPHRLYLDLPGVALEPYPEKPLTTNCSDGPDVVSVHAHERPHAQSDRRANWR